MVSVIVPTYKRQPAMVKRAIQSILNQTYPNIEIIVVDDSPGDFEFRSMVKDMVNSLANDKIRYVEHETNKGACAARNTGINISAGEYLAFLDDDDEWLSNKLEKQLLKMSNPDVGLVYCRQKVVDEISKTITVDKRKFYSGEVFDKLMVNNFIGSTSFVLVRKKCLQKVGFFNMGLESAQDYEMWLRIAKEYEVDYVDEPLVIYHIHGNGRITDNPQKKIQGLESLNDIHSEYLNAKKAIKSIRLVKIIPYYLLQGRRKKAFVTYLEAIKLTPFRVIHNILYLRYFFMIKKQI